MLTHQILIDHLEYDEITGVFIRKIATARMMKVGDIAGTITINGRYRSIGLFGSNYLAHRLAWFYVTGQMPDGKIDHKDGNGLNNSFSNLRNVNQLINSRNQKLRVTNTSGHMGIDWIEQSKAWRVRIGVGNKTKHVGHFKTIDCAVSARKQAESEHGYHANHGRL